MNKHCLWTMAGTVFSLLVLAGCGHHAAPEGSGAAKPPALPSVQIVPVTRGTLDKILPATGTLRVLQNQEATLTSQVTGVLDQLFVRYGQTVTRGQIVAQISTRTVMGQIQQAQATLGQNQVQVQQAEANALQQQSQTRTAILQAQIAIRNAQATLAGERATLTGAEASLQNARQNLHREQTLFQDGLVPQKDVEAAGLAVVSARAIVDAQQQTVAGQTETVGGQREALEAARAATIQNLVKQKDIQVARQQVHNAQGALATARAQLALYTLRAPLSGQVTAVGAANGETVDTATKVATIANLDRLQLQIGVPGSAARQTHPGELVRFLVESLPGRSFQTTVELVSSQVEPVTGTVSVLALVANPGHVLRDDTTVKVEIITERRQGILTVPQAAVLTDPGTGKTSVVVVGKDEVAHVVTVQAGLASGGRIEIARGLTQGQNVAVSGQFGLPDGAKVNAQPAAPGVGDTHGP